MGVVGVHPEGQVVAVHPGVVQGAVVTQPVVMAPQVVQPATMMVSVPPNAAPGAQLMVQTPAGAMMVTVPPGAPPGGAFAVQMPAAAAMPQQAVPTKMAAPMATAAVAPNVAPLTQAMARPDFATVKGALLRGGTKNYETEMCDCCRTEEFPLWCCTQIVKGCSGIPADLFYWMWFGQSTARRMGDTADCANCCCACVAFDYMAGKTVQAKQIKDPADCGWCCRWTFCGYCEAWRVKRELKTAPHLARDFQGDAGAWKQSLLGCCDRPGLACYTCLCYPCAMGNFYGKLGEDCCTYGLCGCFCLQYARGRVAYAKGIREPVAEYACKACFCGPCMRCQLFAKLADN